MILLLHGSSPRMNNIVAKMFQYWTIPKSEQTISIEDWLELSDNYEGHYDPDTYSICLYKVDYLDKLHETFELLTGLDRSYDGDLKLAGSFGYYCFDNKEFKTFEEAEKYKKRKWWKRGEIDIKFYTIKQFKDRIDKTMRNELIDFIWFLALMNDYTPLSYVNKWRVEKPALQIPIFPNLIITNSEYNDDIQSWCNKHADTIIGNDFRYVIGIDNDIGDAQIKIQSLPQMLNQVREIIKKLKIEKLFHIYI